MIVMRFGLGEKIIFEIFFILKKMVMVNIKLFSRVVRDIKVSGVGNFLSVGI